MRISFECDFKSSIATEQQYFMKNYPKKLFEGVYQKSKEIPILELLCSFQESHRGVLDTRGKQK